MKRIILASESPRKKEILSKLGLQFEVMSSDYEEDMNAVSDPKELAKFLSMNKAKSVAEKITDEALIIAADTFLVHEGKLLGKPHTKDDARMMLRSLSGKTHNVITGIALIDTKTKKRSSDISQTKVTMKTLSDEEIEGYINTGEPLDKAGAYAIQGIGAVLIEKIEGDFYTVMGLPLSLLGQKLKEFGVSIF